MPEMWALLVVFLGRALTGWGQEAWGARASMVIRLVLRGRVLESIQRRGPLEFWGGQTGELSALLLQGIDSMDVYFGQYLPQVLLAIAIPASILLVIFPIDLLSGMIFFLTGPLIPMFMYLIGRSAESVTRRQFSALGRMSAFFLDTLQGLVTLKQFNQSHARIDMVSRISEDYRVKTMQVLRLTFLSALALELAATISTAVVAVEVGLRLLYGRIEFSPAFFILILAPEFYLPLRRLGQRFHAGAAASANVGHIQAALTGKGAVKIHASPEKSINLTSPQSIRLEQVSYRYPGRLEVALDSVGLELHAGELTALVGRSGAGKSTLAYMVLGLLQPQEGRICIDGIDLSDLPKKEWTGCVAYVPQHPYLFSESLAANIRLGKSDASLDEVRWAAQLAGLDDFIRKLPQGYDTLAGEQGARLSSGQIQRVALARAFLKNAPVFILDEPTARLDPELEQAMADATQRLCVNKIGLVIAHRVSAVRRAARVVVLENGKLIEQGPPVELLERHGALAALIEGAR